MQLTQLLPLLEILPPTISLQQITHTLSLLATLRLYPGQEITATSLPQPYIPMLSSAMGLTVVDFKQVWPPFASIVLTMHPQSQIFDKHGSMSQDTLTRHGFAAQVLLPPVTNCLVCHYTGALINRPPIYATLFTLHAGARTVTCPSWYCRSCQTSFYHNYYITKASEPGATRIYYPGIPDAIEVSDHYFVDQDLCNWFTAEFAFPQASALSISRVYNMTMHQQFHHQLPPLPSETVLDGFFLFSLLKDESRDGTFLEIPHHGLHKDRLNDTLTIRNYQVAGTGQELWAHACSRCTKVLLDKKGKPRLATAGVVDGVTVGHPCCAKPDCKEPLESHRHHFCVTHEKLRFLCRIEGCEAQTSGTFLTCSEPTHRAFELEKQMANKAMFMARARLRRLGMSESQEDGIEAVAGRDDALAEQPAVDPDPSAPPVQVRAKFTRRWTHNEQLFVRCCGIIISRATFYGSEAISAVADFLRATFPPSHPRAMPCYIFYDNNCKLYQHLQANGDEDLVGKVGLPVDVFHHQKKHKASDIFCQTHCNPAHFEELVGEHNEWIFNSSAAEQANVWFGGFQAIVREMAVPRYNYFLDKMIEVRNRFLLSNLEKQGAEPFLIADEELRLPRPVDDETLE